MAKEHMNGKEKSNYKKREIVVSQAKTIFAISSLT